MAYIVLIIFCGLSAGIVAKSRGNGFWIWFVIGFVLPFVGTIAAFLYRRDRDVEKRRCPECGSIVAIHDQVCMKCGCDMYLTDDAFSATPG